MDAIIRKIKSEPVVAITIVIAVLLVLRDVVIEKRPLGEVLTEEYVTGIVLAAGALAARLAVYAKPNAEAKVERELADASARRTNPPVDDEPNGDLRRWEDEGGQV